MGKCGNCHEEGHTIRTCSKPKPVEEEIDYILLPCDVSEKFNVIVGMCEDISTELKKGFSEGTYEEAFTIELQLKNIQYSTQEVIPITYKGRYVGMNRLDIILHNWLPIIIELKATTTSIKSEEKWQVVRYMTRKDYQYGAVINFNQSLHGRLEIVFIVKHDDGYYQYNYESTKFKKMIDF